MSPALASVPPLGSPRCPLKALTQALCAQEDTPHSLATSVLRKHYTDYLSIMAQIQHLSTTPAPGEQAVALTLTRHRALVAAIEASLAHAREMQDA